MWLLSDWDKERLDLAFVSCFLFHVSARVLAGGRLNQVTKETPRTTQY